MALVDMKLPKRSEKETKDCCVPCSPSQDRWPYGLQLRFETEQIDKLPQLAEYKVGDLVTVTAEARVTDTRMSERIRDGKTVTDRTTEMQIEKIDCEVQKPLSKMSMKEYRKAREGK